MSGEQQTDVTKRLLAIEDAAKDVLVLLYRDDNRRLDLAFSTELIDAADVLLRILADVK